MRRLLAEQAGADNITLHLREDRRHIQDRDVHALRPLLKTRMNLEMGLTDEMVDIAHRVRPQDCCLVPEKRAEITTEGGLDVAADVERVAAGRAQARRRGHPRGAVHRADPRRSRPRSARARRSSSCTPAPMPTPRAPRRRASSSGCRTAAKRAANLGLEVHAGHGLNYHNVQPVAAIAEIVELNIGHCIIARAIFTGLDAAVRDMKTLMPGRAR